MKFMLLAAAAVIAMPALAQTGTMTPDQQGTTTTPTPNSPAQTTPATPPADQTTPPADSTTPPADTMTPQTTPPADANTPPTSDTMTSPAPAQSMPMQQPQTTGDTDPAGGYQPSAPALSGTPQPGATVTFRPAPTPDQAYPAPAPLAKYPTCKPGQYDNCMQASGSGRRSAARRRR